MAGDPAFSRAPRCAQVERAQHCSCEAGFHLSGAAAGDSVCQGRRGLRPGSWRDWGGGGGRRGEGGEPRTGLPAAALRLQAHPAQGPGKVSESPPHFEF